MSELFRKAVSSLAAMVVLAVAVHVDATPEHTITLNTLAGKTDLARSRALLAAMNGTARRPQ